MQELRSSRLIDAPPERVFVRIDDWAAVDRYFPRLRLTHVEGEPDRGTGARFDGLLGLVPGGVVAVGGRGTVVDHFFPERNELRLAGEEVVVRWTLGTVGRRTLIELLVGFKLPGGPAGRLVGSGLGLAMQRDLDAALERLRADVEEGSD